MIIYLKFSKTNNFHSEVCQYTNLQIIIMNHSIILVEVIVMKKLKAKNKSNSKLRN